MITALKAAAPGSRERLSEEFETAKRVAEASSVFVRVPADEGGRFPLTGRGDVNTYALFAELFSKLILSKGFSGVILPTGIATDFTNRFFFQSVLEANRLVSFLMFDNQRRIFPSVHPDTPFGLLTIGLCASKPEFAAYLPEEQNLGEPERRFTLTPVQVARDQPQYQDRADFSLPS